MKTILIVMMALMLSACNFGDKNVRPERTVPANLIEQCRKLPQLTGDTVGDLVENHIDVATLYHECAKRHKALSEWATKKVD